MSRADFQCLIPGNEVHSNILMLAALKTTMTQRIDDAFEDMSNKITTWSLPPQFGVDALNPDMLRQVYEKYKNIWMPKSSALKYLGLLDFIFSGPYSSTNILDKKIIPMDNWPLCNARGIPDCNTSDNSYLYFIMILLEWMAMEDMFQPNLTARSLDSKIRMLATCATLNGTHNEYNDMVRHRSAARWKALVGN
ncbi:hypothetical protein HN873_058265 [Arachis hypogaea]